MKCSKCDKEMILKRPWFSPPFWACDCGHKEPFDEKKTNWG